MESNNSQNQNGQEQKTTGNSATDPKDTSVEEYEQMGEEVNEDRTKKPGSQSSGSDQHNNGRGGGK